MNLNAVLAVVWALVAMVLVFLSWANPANQLFIPGTSLNAAWLALLLVLWNVARWYSIRTAAENRALEAAEAEAHRHGTAPAAPDAPNPAFDFTKPAQRPEADPRQPPS